MSASDDFGDIGEFYELQRVHEWIEANCLRRVALQLPDEFLKHTFEIVEQLEQRLGEHCKVYVLADTSYRSCCLDEVAAEHARCDGIVHFGDACLSSASGSRIPSLFIFCHSPIDLDMFRQHLANQLQVHFDESDWDAALLLCEAGYAHNQAKLESSLRTLLPHSIALHNCAIASINSSETLNSEQQNVVLGRLIPVSLNVARQRTFLIYVGGSTSPLLPLFQMTLQHVTKVLHYDPGRQQINTMEVSTNKMLLKRLFLVEKLRDAHTIGLVIGSVSASGCCEAITRVRALCKQANKKLYTIYIGKMNEAKLSNFGIEIETFILLSCPFGIMLEANKFCRPVLSMFEAEIALNPDRRDWLQNMQWSAEFGTLLNDEIGSAQNGMADLSLVSGQVRCTDVRTAPEEEQNQLVEYSAGAYFAKRSWQGLDDRVGAESGGSELKEGLDGVATRYVKEPTVER